MLLTLAVSALLASAAGAAAAADLEGITREIAELELARSATPGLSIAVIADDRVTALALGLADREAGIPATVETVYPAASVSKLLTAVLVMRQVERRALDLDQPANAYLPEVRWIRDQRGEPVPATLRQLLSHTSGLPVAFVRAGVDEGETALSLDEYLASGLVVSRPPGEKIIYSNEAFALLGYLAARAEGEDFDTHVQRVLLGPLRMTASSFRVLPDVQVAAGYGGAIFDDGSEPTLHTDITAVAPAGSLRTTVLDLARFARMLLRGGELDGVRILAPASLAEMWRLQARPHPDLPQGFGLGFGVLERPGRRMVWWDGDLPGAASRLALLPDAGVGLVLLSNRSDHTPLNAISEGVFTALAGPAEPDVYTPDVAAAASIAGSYRMHDVLDPALWFAAPFLVVGVELREDGLFVDFFGEFYELRPAGPHSYRIIGGIFDGLLARFEGDRAVVGWFEAQRVSLWETPLALAGYASVLALGILAAAVYGMVRLVRRLRAPRPA